MAKGAKADEKPIEEPTVGLITALPIEFATVKALLNEPKEITVGGKGAGRRYVLGEISSTSFGYRHNVVLALLTNVGNNSASYRASLLLERFPFVNWIIMVGIAGGVPNPTKVNHHVRLGDIVVSNEKGIIQYDFNKEYDGGIHEFRFSSQRPSPVLLEGVRFLSAAEIEGYRPWLQHIESVCHKLNISRPSEETDILVQYQGRKRRIKHPSDPNRTPGQPRVFFGPIASANKLLKNPSKRDSLRNEFGVKAVEMEGSGIADATWDGEIGYLVVRGISDYCDVMKGDLWQPYAAAASAAYVVSLLESIPLDVYDWRTSESMHLHELRSRSRTANKIPTNLPHQVSEFVGRANEVREVTGRLMAPGIRLMTLTGTAGIGKTRLAIEAASHVLGQFNDGVWYVELEGFMDPESLSQTIGSVIGVQQPTARYWQSPAILGQAIASKRMLILLDTCERVLPECARVCNELLKLCSNLKILAASREALGIPGEVVWELPPLELPDLNSTVQEIRKSDSVQLFSKRAAETTRNFVFNDQKARKIGEICHQLDGIPLAIELAASRVRDLGTVEAVESRLKDRFSLLIGRSPTGHPRQRTLYAAIAWSYESLSNAQRLLFERLGVFAGGWTLEMAEDLCSGQDCEQSQIMNLHAALVDKSLVETEQTVLGPRYHYLYSIRDFALKQLKDRGELHSMQRKHFEYFLSLSVPPNSDLDRGSRYQWFDNLEIEHDNIKSALQWSLENAPESSVQLVAQCWEFWQIRSYLSEGLAWAEAALSKASEQSKVRAWALMGAGYLARDLWDSKKAWILTEASMTLFEHLGESEGYMMAKSNLAILARSRGDYALARRLFKENLQRSIDTGDDCDRGSRLANLAVTALFAGEPDEAEAYFDQSLLLLRECKEQYILSMLLRFNGLLEESKGSYDKASQMYTESRNIARAIGDRVGFGAALCNLGALALVRSDFPSARTLLLESLSILRATGDRLEVAWTLDGLARLAFWRGNLRRAKTFHQRSMQIFLEVGDTRGMAHCLCFVGMMTIKLVGYAAGVQLISASTASLPLASILLNKRERNYCETLINSARTALGVEAFNSAWQDGRLDSLQKNVEQFLMAEIKRLRTIANSEVVDMSIHRRSKN